MSTDFAKFLNGLSEEQLKNLNAITKELLQDKPEKQEQELNVAEDIDPTVTEDFKVIRTSEPKNRKTPVKFKRNEWIDDGELRDIDTPQFQRTPRNRNKPNKQEVECHVCGKTFSINSSLIYGEFHRCNKCTGK